MEIRVGRSYNDQLENSWASSLDWKAADRCRSCGSVWDELSRVDRAQRVYTSILVLDSRATSLASELILIQLNYVDIQQIC